MDSGSALKSTDVFSRSLVTVRLLRYSDLHRDRTRLNLHMDSSSAEEIEDIRLNTGTYPAGVDALDGANDVCVDPRDPQHSLRSRTAQAIYCQDQYRDPKCVLSTLVCL